MSCTAHLPGVVRLTTGENISTAQPRWGAISTVWAERGDDGIVRVFVGSPEKRIPLLELGHAGEDADWLSDWLTSLADAVRSVDR